MGLANSPDIFQEKINDLLGDLEYIRAYIDDCLIITKSTWEDHLDKLNEVLHRLKQAGLKVNATFLWPICLRISWLLDYP